MSASYYERLLTGVASLCVEKGVIPKEELEQRAGGAFPLSMPSAPGRGNAPERDRFQPGDRVKVKAEHVTGHVRAPGYIRGKTGVVVGVSPAYPFPDAHAHGVHAEDEPTYDVRFEADELWPNSADPAQVHVGVFQSYLERAT
jgi:nitrile hydratase